MEGVGAGDLRWLDGGNVCADDLCLGELIAKVHGPNASAGSNVEHFAWLFDGRQEELAVHDQRGGMVDDVQGLRGLVVVRCPVLSIASLSVVRPPVDGSVLENARVDTRGRTSSVVAYRRVPI